MAKVDGPLFSLEARGKIGDAIVFFPWKGRHSVRRWLKPTNPADIDQKLIRQKLFAIGKCIKMITTPCTALPNGAAIVVAMKAKTPATQIWNAYMVKNTMAFVKSDANFTALWSAIIATDTSTAWAQLATSLGLGTIVSTSPGVATDIPPGIQLAMAAYAAYTVGLSDRTTIYSQYPSAWLLATITKFANAFTAAY